MDELMRKERVSDSVSVVIPLYNNAPTLKTQLEKLISAVSGAVRTYEILICDDGSTDGSAAALKKYASRNKKIRLLTHNRNLGIAQTIRELYSQAKNEYVVLYSLDGDWDPDDVGRLIRKRFASGSDIVVGIRNKKVYSPYRRFISGMYDRLTRLLYRADTFDAGSIKIFKRKLLEDLGVSSKSIFIEAEIIIKATMYGHKVTSIPVSFHKKIAGSGAGGSLRNVYESVIDLLALRFSLKKPNIIHE